MGERKGKMQAMIRMESVSFEKRKSLIHEDDPADCSGAGSSGCKYQLKTANSALFMLLACTMLGHVDSLRFTSIQMPALVQRGTNFWLSCQYELQTTSATTGEWPPAAAMGQTQRTTDAAAAAAAGQEQLYSVKWYKNNEEFYRIIFASAPVNQQPTAAAGQQQYFTQPGVNVLMSSSNSTHVRLLNVSLESEGSYACEISTQNLSTIRFEKEIKVYVLPSGRLNLIGLRSLYALGDQVELNCVSDFSRPAGALGWFINGRRVITSSEANARFRLGPQLTRRKANELKLARSSLMLKFKLTNELLVSVAPVPMPMQRQSLDLFNERQANIGNNFTGSRRRHHESDTPAPIQSMLTPSSGAIAANRRNQSKLSLLKTSPDDNIGDQDEGDEQNQRAADDDDAAAAASRRKLLAAVSGLRLVELLRLECRNKLTEVSDVTFSELKVAASAPERPLTTSGLDGKGNGNGNNPTGWLRRQSRRGADASAAGASGQRRRPSLQMAAQQQQQTGSGGGDSNLSRDDQCRRLKLFKSLTNQIQSSSCVAAPAGRDELLDLMRGPWATSQSVACRAGLLALQREDPVILKVLDDEREEVEEQDNHRNGPNKGDRVELAPGSTIGVNCSTLGALLSSSHERPLGAGGVTTGERPMTMRLEELVHDEQRGSREASLVEGDNSGQSVGYCSDTEARKRLLISGKYQTANELQWAQHSNQRHKTALTSRHHQKQQQQHQKRHHIAYVALEQEDQQQQQQHKRSSGSPANSNNINNGRHHRHKTLANSTQLVPGEKLNLTPALNLNEDQLAPPAESSEFALWSEGTKSLGQLHDNLADDLEANNNNNNMQQSAWLTPPLLEWFINNQEATESSAKYSPELPLITPSAQQRWQTTSAVTDEDQVVSSLDLQPLELPSIDYREYFANFDSRSIDQHLVLRMRLDKKHFMTPDSLLRLRCTSTQAQVLAMDSLDVSLFAIPPKAGQMVNQNGKQSSVLPLPSTQQTGPSSSWIHRPPSIKSKYIHHKLPTAGQRGFGPGQSASQSPSLQQSNGSDGNGHPSNKFQFLVVAITIILLAAS